MTVKRVRFNDDHACFELRGCTEIEFILVIDNDRGGVGETFRAVADRPFFPQRNENQLASSGDVCANPDARRPVKKPDPKPGGVAHKRIAKEPAATELPIFLAPKRRKRRNRVEVGGVQASKMPGGEQAARIVRGRTGFPFTMHNRRVRTHSLSV